MAGWHRATLLWVPALSHWPVPRQKLLQMLVATSHILSTLWGMVLIFLGSARRGKKEAGQLASRPKSPRRCVPISCTTNPWSPAPPGHRFLLLCRFRRSPGGCWCSESFAVIIFRAHNSAELVQALCGGGKARGDDNCGRPRSSNILDTCPLRWAQPRGFRALLGKPGAPEGIRG